MVNASGYCPDYCVERLSLHPGAKGILSATGYRTHRRTGSRTAGCFFRRPEGKGNPDGEHRSEGPRCRKYDGVRWRRRSWWGRRQHRKYLSRPEARRAATEGGRHLRGDPEPATTEDGRDPRGYSLST